MARLFLLLAALALVVASSAQTSLSPSEKQQLLALHNQERSTVNPSASDMKIMVWNEELARVAQQYAERCVFRHNQDRSQQARSFNYVGENIAAGSGYSYERLFQGWADEKNDYSFNSNSCRGVCGHYTQIVWADSAEVGCGIYECANLQYASFDNAIFLVCNYGPGGNFIGNRPYTSGSSCAECETGYQHCVNDKLCSQQSASNQPQIANTTGATTPNGAMGSMVTSTTTLLMLLGLVALTLLMA